MSATEDAHIRPLTPKFRLTTLALALLTGATLGAVLALFAAPADRALFEVRMPWRDSAPAVADWPRTPRAGESVTLVSGENGPVLLVRAARSPEARELATAFATRRESAAGALEASARSLNAQWRSRLFPEALPALSPNAEVAALLQAHAMRSREAAQHLVAPWAGASPNAIMLPPAEVARAYEQVVDAAHRADAIVLANALTAQAAAQDEWIARGVPSPAAAAAERGAQWRALQLARADSLEALAAVVLADETPLQVSLAQAAAAEQVVELANAQPNPYAALLASQRASHVPNPAPLPDAWGRWLGLGALCGAFLAFAAAAVGLWLRPSAAGDSLLFLPKRDPADRSAWLHVVSGPTSVCIARASLELAAHALANGERVLVVDGGPKLRLHERFGREARWGLMECLLADMPVLGLVQYGGRPGFYLLAHGNPTRGEGWASLGQRLDDARPHFGRIILALDTHAPRAIGDALAGRTLEGWWGDASGQLGKGAVELSTRLGIAFSGMDLSVMPEESLEVLSGRVRALMPLQPVLQAAAPEPLEVVPVAEVAPPVPEPVVLDCDLQVQQRLRFLAWMRRVQSETRPAEELVAH